MQIAQFSILTSRKIMTEITNPHWMPTALQSHVIMANHLGVPPHDLDNFCMHLYATPHIVHQNPHNTTPPMFHMENM